MEVKNIQINDYSIKFNNSKYKNILEKHTHLFPSLTKLGLQFQLIKSNEAFANAIRTVFNDELLVKYLDVSIFNINTDDKYILPDNIIERIASIPLIQNTNNNKKYKLQMTNNTNDIIKIYSKDLKSVDNSKNNDLMRLLKQRTETLKKELSYNITFEQLEFNKWCEEIFTHEYNGNIENINIIIYKS